MKFNLVGSAHSMAAKVAPAVHNKAMHCTTRDHHYSTWKIVLLMKLVMLLTTVVCLQAWSAGHGQTITLSLKNVSLEKVFTEIRRQSPYSFIYTQEQLKGSHPVSLQVKRESIERILELCFKGQPITYEISETHIVIKKKPGNIIDVVRNILIDIKGKVIGERGEPLAGATITVKGSNRVTVADENGEFSLIGIDENAVLIVSSVGYQQIEYKAVAGKNIEVQLKAAVGELGDVRLKVNTGYQEIPRERATGSFTQIDNKLYNQQVSTDVLNRLESISNGLNVYKRQLNNTSGQIMIRGLSTLQGPKSPLIVIDNFPYEGNIENINPNDVENITILKDAAAASIWGTRAGNGVIVITTKKSRFDQQLKIEINSNISITQKPNLSYVKQISSDDFIDVEQFLYDKGFYNGISNSRTKPPLSPVVEILFKKTSGTISPGEAEGQINAFRTYDVRNDFDEYLYRQGINQQYYINVRGGSNKFAWILSGGWDKNIGNLSEVYNRLNLRSENTFIPAKNLQIVAGIYLTQSKTIGGAPGYGSISTINGNIPVYTQLADAQGNALPVLNLYRQSYLDTVGGGKLLDWNYYPLVDHKHVDRITSIGDILINFGIRYKIANGFTSEVKYQYEKQQTNGSILNDQQSFFTRNLINAFSQINTASGEIIYKVPVGSILDLSNGQLNSNQFRGQLNYSNDWKKHRIAAIVGLEIKQVKSISNSNRIYGYNDNILTAKDVDYTNSYPNFITGGYTFIPNNFGISDKLNRFFSVYGNVAYTYNGKYTFSFSGRRDASNLFGVNTNNKWNPLWSAGLAWDLSKEEFYTNSLPNLKLRITYGYSGNVDQSQSGVTTIIYSSTSPFTQTPTARFDKYNNPDLRWEKVNMLNIGVDFEILNNILTGSVEYYLKKGTDLYGPSQTDYTSIGILSIVKNVAGMKAKGLDLQLNSININRKIKWTTDFILNLYRDKITAFYPGSDIGSYFVGGGSGISSIEGQSTYSIRSYKWAGLDPLTGDPQGIYNGRISKDYQQLTGSSVKVSDLVYNGSAFPTIFGSVGNTISYKNLSLTARIAYKLGYYFLKESINYSALFSSRIGHRDYSNRWQKPGDEMVTSIPSMIYPAVSERDNFYRFSEKLVSRADNVRLQYVTISYELTKREISRLPFNNFQVYINMNNLGIIWRANADNLDPDYPNSSIPPSKNVALGIRAIF